MKIHFFLYSRLRNTHRFLEKKNRTDGRKTLWIKSCDMNLIKKFQYAATKEPMSTECYDCWWWGSEDPEDFNCQRFMLQLSALLLHISFHLIWQAAHRRILIAKSLCFNYQFTVLFETLPFPSNLSPRPAFPHCLLNQWKGLTFWLNMAQKWGGGSWSILRNPMASSICGRSISSIF